MSADGPPPVPWQPDSVPPAPPPAPRGLRALLTVRKVSGRWPFALRAGICTGAPVLVGVLAGDVQAGLLASIGAFTSLYGSGRPYANRAVHLAVVAMSLALAVTLGVWAAPVTWLAVLTVVAIASVATFVCQALAVGPPGAYMFVLVCAVGTGMGVRHLDPLDVGLLALAGGAFSWLVHMAGVIVEPRGPEKRAVAAAARSVGAFVEAAGTPAEDIALHRAATAMHQSWAVLVTEQSVAPGPDGTLSRLRSLNRSLNHVLAEATGAARTGRPVPATAAEETRRIAAEARKPAWRGGPTPAEIPIGRPGPRALLRDAATRGSPQVVIAARVGVAVAVAGTIGATIGLDRSYWAMVAAVLVLYQGADWHRTVQRGLERLVGTWVGLLLAAGVVSVHPQGLWLALVLTVLPFAIEMSVVRNYALAVVFITATALTMASGGNAVDDLGAIVLARGVDTTLGCAVGLGVYALTARRTVATRMPEAMARTIEAVSATVGHLATGDVTSPAARADRRDLQHRALAMMNAFDASVGASAGERAEAERTWPAVVAVQRLAYRVLSDCWAIERLPGADAAHAVAGSEGSSLRGALRDLAAAAREGRVPGPTDDGPIGAGGPIDDGPIGASHGGSIPGFLQAEIEGIRRTLAPVRR